MAELPENPDLSWDLDAFNHQDRARDFVLQFESTMCVYSATVEQLYSSYQMFFPEEWQRKLVILPDPQAFHDTFFNIAPQAVAATGLYIIPGELIGQHGLHLANVDESRSLGRRQVPFAAGMRTIIQHQPPEEPFLPILAKGDLREFERSWPVLHLHRVRPRVLEKISELDKNSLANVIYEKLEPLLLEHQKAPVVG